jgi:hypothetical protein
MRLFRPRLPAAARAALATEPGERVLSHAAAETGEAADAFVVASDRALYLPGGVRLPWHRVEHARWEDETTLVVTGTDGTAHRAEVPEPGLVPETIKERVTWSIVASRHVRLGDRGGVRLVARRVPASPDREWGLEWDLVFDQGLDPADPGLRALAEQALEDVRRNLGV